MKHIKDVWATLKLLRISPQDHSFGPDELRVVEEILSASTKVHEKQRQGFEEPWTLLNRCCPATACTPNNGNPGALDAWPKSNIPSWDILCWNVMDAMPTAQRTCRVDVSNADKEKAERELLQKIKEALPEATEPWLVQIVPQKLKEAGL